MMRPRLQEAPMVVLYIYLLAASLSANAFQTESTFRFSGLQLSSPLYVSSSQSVDDFATVSKNQRRQERRELIAIRRREVTELEDKERDRQDRVLLLAVAVVPTILAFVSWDSVSHGVANFLDVYGRPSEKDFSSSLLLPTLTGVLVPVISIALATLVSTTVNVLRDRQLQLRALVNKEACQIRLLRRAVFGMFGTRQHAGRRARAMALLASYVDELIQETNVGAVDALEELELSGGIAKNELDCLSAMIHGVDGASATRQESVGVAEGSIVSLNEHRSDRVALILSVFPDAHWLVMSALVITNIMAFLGASNQQPSQYFSSIQLQLMFTTLVGVCSGTAMLCLDLADPFRGSFSLAQASTQFGDLRAILREDVTEAIEEGKDTSAATYTLIRSYLSGPSSFGIDKNDLILSKWVSDTYLKVGEEVGIIDEDDLPDEERIDASSLLTGNVGNIENLEERSWLSSSQSRYGLLPTLYLHLLKGPLGSNVRAFGDIFAWMSAFVASRISILSKVFKRILMRLRRTTMDKRFKI